MLGLIGLLSGRTRNVLATLLSLATCALLFYAWVTPVWIAWLYAHWGVAGVILPVWINIVTKLTTWKGDDSLVKWIWKQIKGGRKT